MMTVLSVSSGGERGGTVGTDGRLVGFVGGVVWSGGSVDMGLDHSSNSATVAIFTNCTTKRKLTAFLKALRGPLSQIN